MKRLILMLLILILTVTGCCTTGYQPKCRHMAIEGAAVIAERGHIPMIATGGKWCHYADGDRALMPHAQLVSVSEQGEILHWWRYRGGEWAIDYQELDYREISGIYGPAEYYQRSVNIGMPHDKAR